MGFIGLNTAVSGLRAAQLGLGITGHNMSNSEITGYSRQRIVQKDYMYTSVGMGANGTPLKRGMGTDWSAVSQIRNEFLDFSYRKANSKLSFYAVKTTVGAEIEAYLGELQGADNFQSVIQDLWYSIEELTSHPQGIETRDYFLATCGNFVTKANEAYEGLLKYQHNLDQQVRGAVDDINNTVGRIKELNDMIRIGEVSGDNANDYRDERNLMLDRLSELIPINYSYDNNGDISIFSEGHSILSNNSQTFFGLRYTADNYSFVEPVLVGGVKQTKILSNDTPPEEFLGYINYDKPINSERNNDYGILKGLLVARGVMPAYYLGKKGLQVPQGKPRDILPVNPSIDPTANIDLGTLIGASDADIVSRLFGDTPVYLEKPAVVAPLDPDNPDDLNDTAYQTYLDEKAHYDHVMAIHKGLTDTHYAETYNRKMQEWSIDNCMIPKTMMKLDQVFHSIVTMINDTLAPASGGAMDPDNLLNPNRNDYFVGPQDPNDPRFDPTSPDYDPIGRNPNAPYDNRGIQSYIEVFTRTSAPGVYMERWDENGNLIPEMEGDYYTQYSLGNVQINPALLEADDSFNLLALSKSGDENDTRLLNELQQLWKSTTSEYAVELGGVFFNMDESYNKFVAQLATEVAEAKSFVDGQTVQVERAEYKRQTIMGVSMDEELNNMMKYQYAYQAAARILNVIDSMIDKVVNGTGRAGL